MNRVEGQRSANPTPFTRVPRPRFEDYSEKYKQTFIMERREGILQVRLHTDGGPGGRSGWLNVWSQAWGEIGNDPENEVVIITGTGDTWLDFSPPSDPSEEERAWESPEGIYEAYFDALKNTENVIFGINVPTIAAINGPASVHFEFALACDITLCTEGTVFRDPHALLGLAAGDGLGMTFQELMGPRSAYYLYTGDPIDAQTALRFRLVDEVLPADRLLPRAWEIAERIMTMPKLGRLMAKQIIRRHWQRRHVEDAAFHLAHTMLGLLVDVRAGGAFSLEQVVTAEERWQAAIASRSAAH